jgi:hypothetical protein
MTSKKFGKLLLLIVALAAWTGALSAQTRMRSGEVTIFLNNGEAIIDQIKDISNVRLVLATENSGEFNLSDIWMMNFIDDAWNFPAERKQMETDEHYIFQRNGNVASGRIVDFIRERRVFLFENGVEIPQPQVRRIYFSRNVPASLAGGQGGPAAGESVWVGTFGRDTPAPAIEITLQPNGTARMTIETIRNRPPVVLTGRWQDVDGRTIRVTLTNEAVRTDRRTMIFGLEKNTLVSLSGALGSNVFLQRR